MNGIIEILAVLNKNIFPLDEKQQKMIREVSPDINLTVVSNISDVKEEMLKKAEIIFGWPESDQLKLAGKLRWLHLPSAGADSYTDRSLYSNKDTMLTGSSGVFGLPIAEHVFAMILSYNHNLLTYAYQQKDKLWQPNRITKEFYGSTLGVIGLGDLGSEIAKRGKALGARVLAVKRNISEVPAYVDCLYTTDAIDDVLKQSDYVVLALPNTRRTAGIITEERLRKMKPDAFLVNVGRGSLIDQEALIKALKEGWIGGAGLDVTTPEPLPAGNPLWDFPNVIITPHVSGSSPKVSQRRVDVFLKNLRHYINGQALENVIDFTEGY